MGGTQGNAEFPAILQTPLAGVGSAGRYCDIDGRRATTRHPVDTSTAWTAWAPIGVVRIRPSSAPPNTCSRPEPARRPVFAASRGVCAASFYRHV